MTLFVKLLRIKVKYLSARQVPTTNFCRKPYLKNDHSDDEIFETAIHAHGGTATAGSLLVYGCSSGSNTARTASSPAPAVNVNSADAPETITATLGFIVSQTVLL